MRYAKLLGLMILIWDALGQQLFADEQQKKPDVRSIVDSTSPLMTDYTPVERLEFFADVNDKRSRPPKCEKVIDVGYVNLDWWVMRCRNGTMYFAQYANGKIYSGMTCHWVKKSFGHSCDDAVWTINEQKE